ncbi:MAG: MMPL family transporter [Gammaproteobacteria bacterium]|nr:MMPL family transporter [Gammaproteobacteria bacterium]
MAGKSMFSQERILAVVEPLIYGKRARVVNLVWLSIATLIFFYIAIQTRVDAGFDKSIPLEHPYMQVLKQYQDDFGGANTVLVALIQKDGNGDLYNEKFLASLKRATDEIFFLPGVDRSRVSSLFTPDVRYIEVVEGGFKGGNVIPAEYQPTPEMFQLVRENVGKGGHVGRYTTKDQRGAMIFSELLEVDPVSGKKLDYQHVARELEDKIRGRFTNPRKYEFRLKADTAGIKAGEVVGDGFTEPGALFNYKMFDTGRKDENGEPILVKGENLEVVQVDNADYNPNIDVHILGFAKVIGDVTDAANEVVGFFFIALAMTFVLLVLYLGSLQLAVLPLVCAFVAVIWEFGLLTSTGFGIDPFAILVPFLVLAVSVSHGVQYSSSWVSELAAGKDGFNASLETFRRLAIPGTTALITDLAGFLTILLIPIDIIREMALNASYGMMAIIVTNKILMPVWLSYQSVKDVKAFVAKQEAREAVFNPFFRFMANTITQPFMAALIIVVTAGVFGYAKWKAEDMQYGDSQAGVPELRPDARYNHDSLTVVDNFAIGTDILKVIAETDSEACIKYDVMEQIDRFGWRMENTPGVQSVISLPKVAKQVNAAFSEASPKWKVLPRNQYTMVQAITPVPTSTGLLNPDCGAMAVFVFAADHKATTIKRVTDAVETFNRENAQIWFDQNGGSDSAYCEQKTAARRAIGAHKEDLRRRTEKLKAKNYKDAEIEADPRVQAVRTALTQAADEYKKFDKACPVNFALASANVGVMAASNEVVKDKEFPVVAWVYVVILVFLWLSYQNLSGIICIVVPLYVVSAMVSAMMALFGIGMKVATLPVASLAVGIGVDYGIYIYSTIEEYVKKGYTLKDAYYETLRMTGKAVLFTGLVLCGSVATWLWSDLQFQRDMGALLSFAFAANMIGALVGCPALCRYFLKLPNK